jgi:hypothetical protein
MQTPAIQPLSTQKYTRRPVSHLGETSVPPAIRPSLLSPSHRPQDGYIQPICVTILLPSSVRRRYVLCLHAAPAYPSSTSSPWRPRRLHWSITEGQLSAPATVPSPSVECRVHAEERGCPARPRLQRRVDGRWRKIRFQGWGLIPGAG